MTKDVWSGVTSCFELRKVRVTLNGNPVITRGDVEMRKGDLLAVVGPSGAGKSTLLRCLNRLTVIGNTMNINSLALDRLRGEVVNQTARVEAALALGARCDQAVAPMVRKGVRSSLIPTVDNMKTLGLVWIPGLMAGEVLAGADPMEAAVFQIVAFSMILASGVITAVLSTRLMSKELFTESHQLSCRG